MTDQALHDAILASRMEAIKRHHVTNKITKRQIADAVRFARIAADRL